MKVGRPAIFGEPTQRLTVRVPQSAYDLMCQEAQRTRRELSDVVRARLGISSANIDKRPASS